MGDAWEPAKSRYCHPNDTGLPSMPVALIVGDKSHTDLHGTLALTGQHEITQSSGDQWGIYPIFPHKKVSRTVDTYIWRSEIHGKWY